MFCKQAAGIVVFRKRLGLVQYLLLCDLKGEWGFPKGGVEQDETLLETARRETREETGIQQGLELPKGFKEQIHYSYQQNNKKFWKTVDYFLAFNKRGKVKLSSEHNEYTWLSYEEALGKVIFPSQKKILKKAQRYLGFRFFSAKTSP